MSSYVDLNHQLITGGRLEQSDLTFGKQPPTLITYSTLDEALG